MCDRHKYRGMDTDTIVSAVNAERKDLHAEIHGSPPLNRVALSCTHSLSPYMGTKGFDVAFSHSLRSEMLCEGADVDVVCMVPGQVQSGMCLEPESLMVRIEHAGTAFSLVTLETEASRCLFCFAVSLLTIHRSQRRATGCLRPLLPCALADCWVQCCLAFSCRGQSRPRGGLVPKVLSRHGGRIILA